MQNKIDRLILLGIISLTFVLRYPFFFPSSIDWDESTFILMGQSILDGHLPYIELWDNKPPLLFFIFAVIIAISGKSIVIIRIIGSLFVIASAFFVYQAGKYLETVSTGLIAAILFILLTGEMGGKVVMSEVIAALPLTAAFYLMIKQPIFNNNYKSCFLVGLLLSIATLIRFNLAYLDVAIFVYYCIDTPQPTSLRDEINKGNFKVKYLLFYIIGLLIPMLIIIIPYLITNNLLILYKSVVEAPLNYATTQDLSRIEVILHYLQEGLLRSNLTLLLLWVGFLIGLLIIIYQITTTNHKRRELILLLVWLVAIAFSIASSGHTYPHYLIQILPFMAIINAFFLTRRYTFKNIKVKHYILLTIFTIGIVEGIRPIITEYTLIQSKNINDEGYQVAKFLNKANRHQEAVYLMESHIVYWLTNSKPMTKMVTHPSNIGQEALLKTILGVQATSTTEMTTILQQKPLFIVKKSETLYLNSQPEAKKLLSTTLKEKYTLLTRIESLHIYKRK